MRVYLVVFGVIMTCLILLSLGKKEHQYVQFGKITILLLITKQISYKKVYKDRSRYTSCITVEFNKFSINFKCYEIRALLLLALTTCSLYAQEATDRYIEVTGTSEIEIVPDKIHYVIHAMGPILRRSKQNMDSRSFPYLVTVKANLNLLQYPNTKVVAFQSKDLLSPYTPRV